MLDLKHLRDLLRDHGEALEHTVRPLEIGGRAFDFNRRRALMGVINLSPDSANRESVCSGETEAVERGLQLARQGADFVDIGAESSLPHAEKVPPSEQTARIVPVVEALAKRGVLVSVESYHPQVLEAAGKAGAALFNLTGTREEREVFRLARRFGCAVIHCYVQGETVRDVGDFGFQANMAGERESFFAERIAMAEEQGVFRNIVDPGLGFYYRNLNDGKTRVHHQIETFLHTFRLQSLGVPTMNILPHAPETFGEEQRRAAEPFFAVLALLGGSHIVRTHELATVACIRSVLEGYAP